jgi:hypothetical protein
MPERLRWLAALAENAYARMYDATNSTAAAGHYSDAKEALYEAIGLAQSMGDAAAVEQLESRLAHIKAVFRSQFS